MSLAPHPLHIRYPGGTVSDLLEPCLSLASYLCSVFVELHSLIDRWSQEASLTGAWRRSGLPLPQTMKSVLWGESSGPAGLAVLEKVLRTHPLTHYGGRIDPVNRYE